MSVEWIFRVVEKKVLERRGWDIFREKFLRLGTVNCRRVADFVGQQRQWCPPVSPAEQESLETSRVFQYKSIFIFYFSFYYCIPYDHCNWISV